MQYRTLVTQVNGYQDISTYVEESSSTPSMYVEVKFIKNEDIPTARLANTNVI